MSSGTKVSVSLNPAFTFIFKLGKLYEDTRLQNEFYELHDILIDCEKRIFTDMENLRKDRDSIKEDCSFLANDNALSEIDKSRIWNQLKESQKECQYLKEKLGMSSYRLEIAEDRYAKFYEEQSEITNEKNKVIVKLDDMVSELKKQLLHRDQALDTCHEKLKISDEKVKELENKLQGLMDQKLDADQIIEGLRQLLESERVNKKSDLVIDGMRCKQIEDEKIIMDLRRKAKEGNKIVEQLRRHNMEASRDVDSMRRKQMEDEKIIVELRRKEAEGNKKVEQLRRRNKETSGAVNSMRRKQMEDEKIITELRRKEVEANKKIAELSQHNIQASRAVEQLKMETLEAARTMEERYAKVCQNEVEMENQLLERENMLGMCQEKLKFLDAKVAQTEQELHDLKDQKSAADQNIKEMTQKQMEDNNVVMELRRKEIVSNENIKELRRQNMETSLVVDALRCKQMEDDKIIMELRCKETEANKDIMELKQNYVVASRTVEQLKLEILEAAQTMEDRYAKLRDDQSQITTEKNMMISELKDEIAQMENQVSERDKMLEVCREKLKFSEEKVAQTERELRDLKGQSLTAGQIIEELMHKQLESDQTVDDLMCRNLEASETTEKLKQLMLIVETYKLKSEETLKDMRNKQSEVEQILEELRCIIFEADEEMLPEIKILADGLIKVLKDEVQDLANVVIKEATDVNPVSKCGKQISGDSRMEGVRDTDIGTVDTAARVHQNIKSMDQECNGLQNTGCRPMFSWINQERGKGNAGSPHQADPQHSNSPLQAETNSAHQEKELKKPQGSDANEFVDSDNEASLGKSTNVSDLYAVLGEKRKFCAIASSSQSVLLTDFTPIRKRSSRASGNQKKKQIQMPTLERDDSLSSKLSLKPNTGFTAITQAVSPLGSNPVFRRCEDKAAAACDSQSQIWDVDRSSGGSSTDSEDESCSESSINDIITNLRTRKLWKMWISQADMLNDFQEDVQHCMNAVCVLYRQKISTSESSAGPNGGFAHFEAMGGSALAEYLIDGDPEHRLRKFVSDVKLQRPDVLVQCRRIAMDHDPIQVVDSDDEVSLGESAYISGSFAILGGKESLMSYHLQVSRFR